MAASDSGFVISWYDFRSGSTWDIYAQRYNAAGDTMGGNFLVNDDGGTSHQYNTAVAANDSGFIVTWQDDGPTGLPLGPNFMVNSGDTGTATSGTPQ